MNKIKIGKKYISVFVPGNSPLLKRRSSLSARGVHTHFAYEVFFVTDGTLTLVTEDGTSTHTRSCVIIPPNVKHMTMPNSDGCYCLLFEADGISFDGVRELPLSDEVAFYIKTFSKKSEGEARTHLSALIFAEILGSPQSNVSEITSHISAIENYVNSNIRKKLTLADVAEFVHLSEKQVSRIIKRQYGMGFCDMVTDKRMAAARMMLKTTDMRIADIAAEIFAGNECYFYTVFKKKYGMTPLAYRKS